MLYLLVVGVIAVAASAGVFIAAPLLPVILGGEYEPVIHDLRVLCWLIIPLTVQTVPYDVFGALDRHHVRARLYNGVSLAAAAGAVPAIYFFGLLGAFAAAYATQGLLAAALWLSFSREAARETAGNASSREAERDEVHDQHHNEE
jgi:O-antigen/teichoic acid export membrane protein